MSPSFIKSHNPQVNNNNIKTPKGFSLIEVMIAVAVAAIMISIAVPSLGVFIDKMRIDNEISQLNRLVLSARNAAVSFEQNVIVCPLDNGVCTANWQNELTAFVDSNNNGAFLAADDILLKVKPSNTTNDVISYGQPSIRFAPTGTLTTIASTFLYCPKSDKKLGRAIVLTLSGRTYVTTDADHSGQDEFRTGLPVVCP
jgi:prepilin-type N-terminal cleavage/methylation domain-containing protein